MRFIYTSDGVVPGAAAIVERFVTYKYCHKQCQVRYSLNKLII